MTLLFDPARLTVSGAAPADFPSDERAALIDDERSLDAPAREALLDEAFGPTRLAKTSQRLRDGLRPVAGLALVARDQGDIVGTLRCWNVRAGDRPALLLGPVAVAASHRSRGIGSALMYEALQRAAAGGHEAVLLVGDAPYYARFGFTAALTGELELPGPVDRARFLGLEIAAGALRGAKGMVKAVGQARRASTKAAGAKRAA
ncbi:MAG TPA: N-acetyltransferase [Roseiarcus sp.]|jgi:predicted N-acetyltransferase YhbS|nr:N-acetyltransferase [Roseiarcus sp.]